MMSIQRVDRGPLERLEVNFATLTPPRGAVLTLPHRDGASDVVFEKDCAETSCIADAFAQATDELRGWETLQPAASQIPDM